MNTNSCDYILPQHQRKIKPTRRSVSGIYPFRGERPIQFESTLERDFLIRSEFPLNILDVISQPIQVPFTASNGKDYLYTPDFLVYFRLGNDDYCNYPKPLLIEVKPEKEWRKHWRKWLPKWKAAWRYAQDQGWEFHIHDESRIRDVVLKNIRFLDLYKRMQFPAEESKLVIDSIKQMGGSPFHYVLARHFMGIYEATGISHIWHLLATRQLDCDITRPLNNSTELWVPNNAL